MATVEHVLVLLDQALDGDINVVSHLAKFCPSLWRQVDEFPRDLVAYDDIVSIDEEMTMSTETERHRFWRR